MVFSSVTFIFYFLPVFLAFYFMVGQKNAAILTGSVIFYTWGEGEFIFLLAVLIGLNLFAAKLISTADKKLFLLMVAVGSNLSFLLFFKYTNFVVQNISLIFKLHFDSVSVPLPIGISFFTFQLVSYLVDVYWGKIAPERSFIRLGTYILMFPHLIAGPIVRYSDIAGELRSRSFEVEKFGLGVQYFIVGLCQKVLIANSVSVATDHAFSVPYEQLSTTTAWIGALAYTIQIYFDFCGYSNMAIGLAFLMGFRFPINFNYPYMSRSIGEFWRRWHMALSYWFRDYVYIPLGGSHVKLWKTIRNILVVFFLTGLWHGAAWTFIVWGLFHGVFLICERLGLKKVLNRAPPIVGHTYLLLVVVVGWVFFQSRDFAQAWAFLLAMAGFGATDVTPLRLWLTPECVAALLFGCLFSFPVVPRLLNKLGIQSVPGPLDLSQQDRQPALVHPLPVALLLLGFILSIALMVGNSLNPFLYFRF
ncbi:MBOAT family protein [Rhizobium sp. P32RR-XVIII]|uniref:MBOAT family O-acyltransferase n=1 Tax=Rhizobium sp. P32RR-XVIII TaxID=2726738 RepID=UPI00145661EF|nr:MBOAT family protein [Rhizobium sp. P32RR-XVIII]